MHGRMCFRDEKLIVYPVEIKGERKSIFSYLCIPTQARGSFNPKKAKDIKGLVPKLHYKLLTAGEIVTLEDGVIVTPQDVCEDPTPSQCFLFVFLDDPSQLEGLLKNADLASLMKELVEPTHERRLASIYHSVPWAAINDASYKEYFS